MDHEKRRLPPQAPVRRKNGTMARVARGEAADEPPARFPWAFARLRSDIVGLDRWSVDARTVPVLVDQATLLCKSGNPRRPVSGRPGPDARRAAAGPPGA